MSQKVLTNGSTFPMKFLPCQSAIVHTHRCVSPTNADITEDWEVPLLPPLETIRTKRPIRVYIDGCFDVMHFGHVNALRQAKALGDQLVVGVCSSHEIAIHKGPSVMNDDERAGVVSGMKWVDEIVRDAPYVLTDKFLRTLIETHHIDIVVHGDDPCLGAGGVDAYATAKRAGRFRTIKRTEGVSSTDVVQRLLNRSSKCTEKNVEKDDDDQPCFLMTARRVVQFAGKVKVPRVDQRVVYIHGAFDLFHAGHVELLKRAKELGDFLLVGIVSDSGCKKEHVMNVHERSLMVLGCRHVDDVIIGAPRKITHDLVTSMNISVVVKCIFPEPAHEDVGDDAFKVASQLGLLKELHVQYPDLEVDHIVKRVGLRRDEYEERNKRKFKSNKEYTQRHKRYVEEI